MRGGGILIAMADPVSDAINELEREGEELESERARFLTRIAGPIERLLEIADQTDPRAKKAGRSPSSNEPT